MTTEYYKQTFHMFLLHDLCFVLCSLDLDVQHVLVQMIIFFFNLITHKSMRLEKSNHHNSQRRHFLV